MNKPRLVILVQIWPDTEAGHNSRTVEGTLVREIDVRDLASQEENHARDGAQMVHDIYAKLRERGPCPPSTTETPS